MTDQEEFNQIAEGMEEVNREMAEEMERTSPLCHMRPMVYEVSDEYLSSESWWECPVCGHTKDSHIRRKTTNKGDS